MTKSEFLSELHEMLEISSIKELTPDTVLKEIEEYDSLFLLTIISIIDEKFGIQLTADQLSMITTLQSLTELIGIEKFE